MNRCFAYLSVPALLLAALALTAPRAAAQPANNNFANRISLTGSNHQRRW
jgi:hypothetical protein